MSHLRDRLEAGKFMITTEMEPPKGTDLPQFLSTAALLKDKVHAVNVPLEPELKRFQGKVEAGARFFQTQAIYDLEAFARFMEIARKLPVYILAGLIPLRSARMGQFLNEKVPGIHVPAAMIERLDKTS